MVILQTRVDFSIFFLCIMFSIGFAQLNVVKRDYVTTKDRKIRLSSTTFIMQTTPSPAACVSLCSIHKTCCCASYDRKTKQCNLDESCCPESEPSADAMMFMIFADSLLCQNGWLRHENKCYYFSDDTKTWKNAENFCENASGILVEVDSKCENDYLKMKARKPGYWLGGTDKQKENVWIWSKSQNEFTFADWKSGEPNNLSGIENCLVLWGRSFEFAWYDVDCHRSFRFICEQDLLNYSKEEKK